MLDGEIICLDKKGRPQFRDLLFHRAEPCFFAFDLLMSDGKDLRTERLTDRKQDCGKRCRRFLHFSYSGVHSEASCTLQYPVESTIPGVRVELAATAHKIARILYHVLSTKEPYTETVFHLYDEQAHQRAEMRLRKQAARLGFQLLPIPATGE